MFGNVKIGPNRRFSALMTGDHWRPRQNSDLFRVATNWVSFYSHPWIHIEVIIRKRSNRNFRPVLSWSLTSNNNRAPLLCHFKLCVSFRSHLWIQSGFKVRKYQNWGTIVFDLWDLYVWPLTLTFRMDITFANVIIPQKLWKGCNRQTGGRADGQEDSTLHRAAWSQENIKAPQ